MADQRKPIDTYVPLSKPGTGSSEAPSKPTSMSWEDYARILAGMGLRVGGTTLGAMGGFALGGPIGAVVGGAAGGAGSEALVEKFLEPKHEISPGRVAVGGAMGAIPGSWMVRAGRPAISAAIGGGIGYGSTAANKLAEGEGLNKSLNPAEWSGSDYFGVGAGALTGGLFGRYLKGHGGPAEPGATPPPPPPSAPPQTEAAKDALLSTVGGSRDPISGVRVWPSNPKGPQPAMPAPKSQVKATVIPKVAADATLGTPEARFVEDVGSLVDRKVGPIVKQAEKGVKKNLKSVSEATLDTRPSTTIPTQPTTIGHVEQGVEEGSRFAVPDPSSAAPEDIGIGDLKAFAEPGAGPSEATQAALANPANQRMTTQRIVAARAAAKQAATKEAGADLADLRTVKADEAGNVSGGGTTKEAVDAAKVKAEQAASAQDELDRIKATLPVKEDPGSLTTPLSGVDPETGLPLRGSIRHIAEPTLDEEAAALGGGSNTTPTDPLKIAYTKREDVINAINRLGGHDKYDIARTPGGAFKIVEIPPLPPPPEPGAPAPVTPPPPAPTPKGPKPAGTITSGKVKLNETKAVSPPPLVAAPIVGTKAATIADTNVGADALEYLADAHGGDLPTDLNTQGNGTLPAEPTTTSPGVPIPEVTSGGLPASPAADIAANMDNPSPVAKLLAMPEANPSHPDHSVWQQLKAQVLSKGELDSGVPTIEPPPEPPLAPTPVPLKPKPKGPSGASGLRVGGKAKPAAPKAEVPIEAPVEVAPAKPAVKVKAPPPPDIESTVDVSNSKNAAHVRQKVLDHLEAQLVEAKVAEEARGTGSTDVKGVTTPPPPPRTIKVIIPGGMEMRIPQTSEAIQGVMERIRKSNPTPFEGIGGVSTKRPTTDQLIKSTVIPKPTWGKVEPHIPNEIPLEAAVPPVASELPPPSTPRLVKKGKVVDLPRQEAPLPKGAGVQPIGHGSIPEPIEPGSQVFPPVEGGDPAFAPARTAEEAGGEYDRIKNAIAEGKWVPEEVRASAGAEAADLSKADNLVKKGALNPNRERGAIGIMPAMRVAGGLSGAAVGATQTPDDPMKGAMIGGAVGVLAPSAVRALIGQVSRNPNATSTEVQSVGTKVKDAVTEFARMLPDWQRFSLLADTVNLPINVLVGPYGSALMGGIEHALSGLTQNGKLDPRGLAVVKDLLTTNKFGSGVVKAIRKGEAGRLIHDAAERTEGVMGQAGPKMFRDLVSSPGKAMAAGDISARNILMANGFTEAEARTMTLTAEPNTSWGQAIAKFKKGAQTKGGQKSIAVNLALPFYRTAVNQMERSLERTPIVGIFAQRAKDISERDPAAVQFAQQTIGGGVAGAAFLLGTSMPNTDPTNPTNKIVRKFINEIGGQYGTLVSMAFVSGQAYANGKSTLGAIKQRLTSGDLPLPSVQPINDASNLIQGLMGEKPMSLPGGVLPGIFRTDRPLSIGSLVQQMMADKQPTQGARPSTPTSSRPAASSGRRNIDEYIPVKPR